jgi:ubiquinone/menaquinone biosynthesis C-methylase UbiE
MIVKDHFIKSLFKKVEFKGQYVLEIGCGDGARTSQFGQMRGVKIEAIDPDEKSIAYAKENNYDDDINYQVAKAEALPFSEKTFDIVIFTLSLHHINSGKKALTEACRVLKNKGTIVVIEPGNNGTLYEAEINFDCFGGDETKQKAKAYNLIIHESKMKMISEFWGETEWKFESLIDFTDAMVPKKNLHKLELFLNKNKYKLWGERRINVFVKK